MDTGNENVLNQLEENFEILHSKVRLEILRYIARERSDVKFKDIDNHLASSTNESYNLSFHLEKLVENGYIEKLENPKRYSITTFGKKMFEEIERIQDLIFNKNTIKVRTSKYSLEDFDESKIQAKLIEEAQIPKPLATKIANDAKKRLYDAKITYLTAPLIREYINAILIENQYEDYRHKLTRLGVPPYDIRNLLESNQLASPVELKNHLGTLTLEQYMLIDQINQRYADLILGEKFTINNLENFSFSPLELVLSGDQLWEIVSSQNIEQLFSKSYDVPNSDRQHQIANNFDLPKINQNLRNFILRIKDFFKAGLSIIRFDLFLEMFFTKFSANQLKTLFADCFQSCSQFSPKEQILVNNSAISLQISLISNRIYLEPLFDLYCQSPYQNWLPRLQIHITPRKSKEIQKETQYDTLSELFSGVVCAGLQNNVFYDNYRKHGFPDVQNCLTNMDLPVVFNTIEEFIPRIIFDHISLNLLEIYQESIRDLDEEEIDHDLLLSKFLQKRFFKILEKRILTIFNFCENEYHFIHKNVGHFQNWAKINHLLHNPSHNSDPLGIGYFGICFYGLEELIFAFSGLFIRNQKKNQEFASKVIHSMNNLVQKQNKHNPNLQFILGEPRFSSNLAFPESKAEIEKMLFIPKPENNDEIIANSDFHHSNRTYQYQYCKNASQDPISWEILTQIYDELAKSGFDAFKLPILLNNDVNQDSLRQIALILLKKWLSLKITYYHPTYLQENDEKLHCIWFGNNLNLSELTPERREYLLRSVYCILDEIKE